MSYLLFLLGLTLLIYSSSRLVEVCRFLSHYFQVKPWFFSIVLLGMGSSAPEFFVSTLSAFKGFPDIAAANAVGSNIANILFILGLTGCFYKHKLSKDLLKVDLPFQILFASFLILFLAGDFILARWEAGLMLVLFGLYLRALFKNQKFTVQARVAQSQSKLVLSMLSLVVSFLLLFLGAYLTLSSARTLGEMWGFSDKWLGLFLVSIGTSLPELAVSLQAIIKKEGSIAIGNILGSNAFNLGFVLSSAGIVSSLKVSESFFFVDCFVMLFVTCLFMLALKFLKELPRFVAAAGFIFYCGYLFFSL